MLFLDGVGIGRKDVDQNPFFAGELESLRDLLGGKVPHLNDPHYTSPRTSLVPISANLGVPGLPQSGTGQTSLLTGTNAPRFIGKHFGPYPYSSLKPILREENVFHRLHIIGKSVFYANAFPRQFFEHIKSTGTRMTAITMSWVMSGFQLNDHATLSAGKSLSSDITSGRWSSLGYPEVPVLSPQAAGSRLVEFTKQYDFVLFEYYLTDHAGHSQSMPEAINILRTLDEFLEGIMNSFDDRSMLLIITSDHGNLEDLSVKTHTRNPVPLLCVGAQHRKIVRGAKDLTDVVPAILRILS
jgi:hypothetical protein